MANTPIPTHDNPMMLSVNAHAHVQAHQTHFPSVPPSSQPANNTWTTTGQYTYVPIAPAAPSSYEKSHAKHARDGQHLLPMQEEEESYVPVFDGLASPSCGKKQRPSNYRPPQSIDKKSLVAVTGSLVGGAWEQNMASVRMRRELSGGQLDQFFRDQDGMEDDEFHLKEELRPRSMSF